MKTWVNNHKLINPTLLVNHLLVIIYKDIVSH